MENKTEEPKKEQAKNKVINLPTQKTFKFWWYTNQEKIDSIINAWLKQMALKNQTPFLEKIAVQSKLFSSKIIYVFMFPTSHEIVTEKTFPIKEAK